MIINSPLAVTDNCHFRKAKVKKKKIIKTNKAWSKSLREMKTKVTQKKERGRDEKKETRRITGRKNYRRKKPHALTHAPYYRIKKLKKRRINM